MKKNFKYFAFALLVTTLTFFTACKTEEPIDPNAGKAKIENLKISPESTLKYGDVVTLTGDISDETGLRAYTISMSNATGTIFEVTKMLTGKTFAMNEALTIPLPKNATAGDMTLSVTVKNAADALITKDLVIKDLGLPVFDQLYIIINNTAYPMKKNGNVFEVEDFFPAKAVGKIYANTDKSGISWGLEGTVIQSMGSNDITFGKDNEEYYKISFNPISFELTLGATQTWNPMTESLYILGNISGHWADGEIDTEKAKMKMSGFTIGTQKMWTWTAPNTGTGDPADDMWGNIVAGTFRFKKASLEQYIVYSGGKIVTGADNIPASFVISAGGPYTIKVFSTDGTTISKVRLTDGTKTLEYTNEGIFINGVLVVSTMTFAGNTLNIVQGKYYEYDGTMTLTKNQAITAQGINLTTAFCDPDVFSGKGNANWTVVQESGQYYVHIDAFSGNVYVRKETGYPDVIYMDGWCWGKYEADSHNWNQSTMMTLYKKGTTNVYEGTLYIFPWGGDVAFFAAPITNSDISKMEIYSKYFEGVTMAGNGLKLPVPTATALYKVSVDLKDGFTFDKVNMDGTNYTIVPTNNKKFTVTFTAL